MGVGGFLLQDEDVIELGAGCGLVGIAVKASGRSRSVTLTDCNSEVLHILTENCRNNFREVTLLFFVLRTTSNRFKDIVTSKILFLFGNH